jgi:hypothetical protein
MLNLSIGYEQDISPATVAGAILEALEAGLVDEMGIVFVKAEETLTIYAPIEEVRAEEAETSNPPETPKVSSAGDPLNTVLAKEEQDRIDAEEKEEVALRVCPDCEKIGFELCDDCKRKPNL